jgi:hypothetical protein
MLKSVQAMPGVEPIRINAQASPSIAAVAVDPGQPNIGGTNAGVQEALKVIAKGT